MPFKKKSSKTPSKLSNSDNQNILSSSPSSPSVSSSISPSPLFNNPNLEEEFSSYLDEASAKFPFLISRTAFLGRVSSDAAAGSKGCRIWLSENAMISSSISPGSLVSVSVASVDKVPNGFPLSDLSDECASHFGFDLAGDLTNEAGNFFALATVYPSSKILKNGVCLSLNLSYTLGCPSPGRIVFVYPVPGQPLTENGNSKSRASCFSLDSCKELCLFPIHSKGKSELQTASSSHVDLRKESRNGQVENSEISSPKTPSLSQSRAGSPSPSHSHTSSYKKSASFDILDVKEVLGDDSSRKLLELCTASWLCSRTLLSGNFVIVPVLSRLCVFQVVCSKKLSSNSENFDNKNHESPAQDSYLGKDVVVAFSIDQSTKIHFLLPGDHVVETSGRKSLALPQPGYGCVKDSSKIDFTKLGGLSKEFAVLKDLIVSSAVKGTLASLGLWPAKGVLLHGPPGTGKTTLARQCAHEAGVNLFSVNGSEVFREYHGESEQALHEVFAKASQAAPAVVFIDEIDVIAPARKDGGGEVSQRMVATLLDLMDGISRTNGLVVVAATNRPNSIEPALRRPGRLDREIEIGVPSSGQRYEILLALLSEMQHSFSDKDVQQLAMVTHGFVGADLVALCTEAARARLQKCVHMTQCDSDFKLSTNALNSVCRDYQNLEDSVESNLETDIPCSSETQSSSNFTDGIGVTKNYIRKDILRITSEDFEKARIRVRPSAMREIHLEVPKVSWEDVGGQIEVKIQLREAVEWPQKHKDDFKRIGTRPPTGILLFGPPGCSKTLLARAVASEAGLNFFAVKGPELFSKWVGESEKAVRSLFAKARANAPSIIFFDEIDGLAVIRGKENDGVSVGDRVITQLLVELDGLQQRGNVTVIAATNRPEKIDPALLRPGRFDRRLYVGPPNKKDREDIFRVHLQRKPCNSNVSISELSLLTEGCTGADISLICNQAAFAAMEEDSTEITMEHLKSVIQHVRPSDIQMYQELSKKFQRAVHSTVKEDDLISEQPCSSSKQTEIPFWTKIRSVVGSIFRIPTFVL